MIISLFFYASMITSLLAIVAGLVRKTPAYFYLAAATALPTSLYLAAAPWLSLWPLAFPVLLAGAGPLCKKRWLTLAGLLVAPYVAAQLWLVSAVLSQ